MFHIAIGLQTRDIVTFEKYQPSTKQDAYQQFQVNRFKAYQHLKTTINKSNRIFL
jgi:hypothetical protein